MAVTHQFLYIDKVPLLAVQDTAAHARDRKRKVCVCVLVCVRIFMSHPEGSSSQMETSEWRKSVIVSVSGDFKSLQNLYNSHTEPLLLC